MTERMRRVNEALREVVSESISDIADPRIGFVTVTQVRASPDLAQATVYVSVLGDDEDRASAADALAEYEREGGTAAADFFEHLAAEARAEYGPRD